MYIMLSDKHMHNIMPEIVIIHPAYVSPHYWQYYYCNYIVRYYTAMASGNFAVNDLISVLQPCLFVEVAFGVPFGKQ